jgi:tRNA-dihydrouridine synthase B
MTLTVAPRVPPVPTLQLGQLRLQTPLLLAPMAGITSAPFRLLCAKYGAELCVSEMIIASTLVQQKRAALELARWSERSLQSPRLNF